MEIYIILIRYKSNKDKDSNNDNIVSKRGHIKDQ